VGFYIRKSVSAGPFRFNLSRSGVGISVGVKGFRVGSGPRGNYVHMGRGGLYYRASLGGARRSVGPRTRGPNNPVLPTLPPMVVDPLRSVETGNVLEMVPSNGSDIVRQINEKMARMRLWPWMLGCGLLCSAALMLQPNAQPFALALVICTAVLSILLAYVDIQRKTVVIMYDLNDDVISSLNKFAQEFDKIASARAVWNVDTAGRTYDWKRNAGASHLITRKRATFGYNVPSVIKTNMELPSIVGGRQSVYFFPDVILITENNSVGAISYEEFNIYWNNTVFIENDMVPADARVVGHTWRYVNKTGGPDRRFNNNRQIPEVLYQEMELQGSGGFRKLLQISRIVDRSEFDTALTNLRGLIKVLERQALEPPPRSADSLDELESRFPPNLIAPSSEGSDQDEPRGNVAPPVTQDRRSRSMLGPLAILCAVFGIAGGVAVFFVGLYARDLGLRGQAGSIAPAAPSTPATASTGAATNGSAVGSAAGAGSSAIAGQVDAYTQGIADWRALKAWSDGVIGVLPR
jgi:hypothetical protein